MVTASRQQLASARPFDVNNNANGNGNGRNGEAAERMQPSQVLGSNLNGADVYTRRTRRSAASRISSSIPAGRSRR
jgi:hypothetical protein